MRSEARYLGFFLAVVAGVSGCAHGPSTPERTSATSSAPAGSSVPAGNHVDAGNLKRVRSALPSGYEIADLKGPISIAALWGFGAGWEAEPARCAVLADPVPADPAARGMSASGPGGTIYVIVSDATEVVAADTVLIDSCRRWTMAFSHTTASVELTAAPAIEGAATLAAALTARTAVESGMETDTEISTASAYLDGSVVTVTLLTDPGSRHAPLEPPFVNDLLGKTVTALRG